MEYIVDSNTNKKTIENKKEDIEKDIRNDNTNNINEDKVEISKEKLYNLKKSIINNSKNLKKIEYIQIFKIIHKYNIQFMENINGIFINLNNIEYNILEEINILINYIKSKNKELDNKEKILKRLNSRTNN